MQTEISTPADAAFELLRLHRAGGFALTRRAAQFCGGLIVDVDSNLTEPQIKWISQLSEKAGLPPFGGA